jgi:hypothetical protein
MRAITKHIVLALISGGFLLAVPARSVADMVTYTLTADASGSLGDSNFSDALVTLTFVGDTGTVTNPSSGIFRNAVGTATVTVGGTTATLDDGSAPADVFVNQTDQTAGIETFATILTVQISALANYDLTTSIGPLTGTAAGALNTQYATTAGNLELTSLASTGTFQATVSTAVPEPASLLLMGLGITGMAAATCVRRAPARRTK